MNKTFTLATLSTDGAMVNLDLPQLMSRNKAELHAQQLRKLMPNAVLFVINTKAE